MRGVKKREEILEIPFHTWLTNGTERGNERRMSEHAASAEFRPSKTFMPFFKNDFK